LAPHNILKVKLQEGITMREEKENWEKNKMHVLVEVSHVNKMIGHNLDTIDNHRSRSTNNNKSSITLEEI
jgi:hypothetical protein